MAITSIELYVFELIFNLSEALLTAAAASSLWPVIV